MLNLQKLAIDLCVEELRNAYERTYSNMEQQLGNIIMWSGRLVLENIANSDALYHNVEHTVMVTLAGQSIIEGKHLLEGGVAPRDWVHYMMAVLCHDIGYVRGICGGDRDGTVATGIGDETVEIPHGASDAALSPYHVDRSKLFVRERFGKGLLMGMVTNIDAELIASYIEMSRFPVPNDDWYKDTEGYPGLVRAADFIGQLGDPNRPRKSAALFFEFEETGSNEELGYKRPGDLHDNYAKFYWDVVSPYIQEALRYLRVTQEGKQWIANLYANVFGAEHECHIYRTCS
ncbi:MAG: metal-dependent phosphohydrolase [Deltaproteobacteria bacterium]|nr:metal-dependent phosphohydrolase [Deltaproteobacteria bacterium]